MQEENKILELRKQNNLSQEQLAEKMGVARQTISKWELGETSPDLEQAKKLSKIFNISLDDLTCNDIKNVMITKINNTEKLTKTIINILKITLLIIIIIVILLLSMIFFKDYFDVQPSGEIENILCTINGKEYTYEIYTKFGTPNTIEFHTNDKELNIDTTKYNKSEWLLKDIKEDVTSRGGTCN